MDDPAAKPPQPIIEAEIVPAPAARAVVKAAPPKQKVTHSYSEVVLLGLNKAYERGRLSEREGKLIAMLLKTGSVSKAAEEIGVSRVTAWRYLQRPYIKRYIEQMRARAAKAADLTLDKVSAVIGEAVDGKEVTELQLKAAGLAVKLLAPSNRPGVQVNVQNNFNGASPFANLEPKDMLAEIRANLKEMGMDEA